MKKIILFFLLFTFAISNYSFSYKKIEKIGVCMDGLVAYITVNGVEYNLHGPWPTNLTVTYIVWFENGTYHNTPGLGSGNWGSFASSTSQVVNLDFYGYNGDHIVVTNGQTYQ